MMGAAMESFLRAAPLAKYLGLLLLVVGVYTLAFLDYAAKGPTKRQRKQQRRLDKQASAAAAEKAEATAAAAVAAAAAPRAKRSTRTANKKQA